MLERPNTVKYVRSSYDNGTFLFTYAFDEREITINLTHNVQSKLSQEAIERIGFNIGMCYLMDLAEILLPKKIQIYKKLPEMAMLYWRSLYEELVIEKCYALQLPTAMKHVTWEMDGDTLPVIPLLAISGKQDHAALCLTGGKESLSLFKTLEDKKPLLLFFLNPETNVHRQKVLKAVEGKHLTVRTISNREELLLPLEEEYGGLQSGVDMAHLVFNTMLYADVCQYVMIGNEYSSNYPNDVYEGSVVNHQFVKTIHFAENLNNYVHAFVTTDFSYYSPFFGLYEYKIADLLFKDDRYLDVWTSCNRTTPETNFCSNCAKCAFTYLLARNKKSEAFLEKFFSRNMLNDVEVYKPLMDFTGKKPLDCVGDKTEAWVALENLYQAGVSGAAIGYYAKYIRPRIATDIEEYKHQITSTQRVPLSFPEDIRTIIYEAFPDSVEVLA